MRRIQGSYVIVYDHYLDLKKEYGLDNGDVLLLAKVVALDIGLGVCTVSDKKLASYLNETVRNIQKRLARLEEKKLIARKLKKGNADESQRIISVNYEIIGNQE